MDKSAAWTVDEVNVPDGYSKSVIHEGNDWTITNKTDTPPTTPPTTPPATPPSDPPDDVPPTGDTSNTGLWLTLALCSLAGLLAVTIYGKKKYYTRRGK